MVIGQVELPEDGIAEFCRRRGITRLELFGSALRDDFTEQSDLDFLYVLDERGAWGFGELIQAQEELSRITGRKVDLVSRLTIEESPNPWRRRNILGDVRVVYAI